ncbi:MAG: glycosyltransferase [Nitrospiraceae bacterium]|nr:glycosyltransferase [Nitrospiraceae bacterium]
MKILLVHNRYRFHGGEDAIVDTTLDLLRRREIDVSLLEEPGLPMNPSLPRKFRAFASGIYSRASARMMARLLAEQRPDIVHSHNLYPSLSPSVLRVCRRAGVPVVMTCHNFRLICPIGVHYAHGEVCERCAGGREYYCALRNCQDNRLESAGYALRGMVARWFGLYVNNVTCFIAISDFVKRRLVAEGFDADRVQVVPNVAVIPAVELKPASGDYIACVARLSPDKGVDVLIRAARRLPQYAFRIAGEGPLMDTLRREAPNNVKFLGQVEPTAVAELYRGARLAVVPSTGLEGFGLVAVEAMGQEIPVVASNIGALGEVVDEGVTGLLFEAGNDADLASKLGALWDDADRRHRMGQSGRAKAVREYGEDIHFQRLMAVYEKAFRLTRERTAL